MFCPGAEGLQGSALPSPSWHYPWVCSLSRREFSRNCFGGIRSPRLERVPARVDVSSCRVPDWAGRGGEGSRVAVSVKTAVSLPSHGARAFLECKPELWKCC